MAVTYKKLFHLMIDKGMSNAELMEQNGAYRHLYDSQMVLENYGKQGNA